MGHSKSDPETDCVVRDLRLPPALAVNLPVCRRLAIADVIDRICPIAPQADLTHGQVAEFVILHLLQTPQRLPLYRLHEWADEHNVRLLYGCPAATFNDDRIRRTLDALFPAICDVETDIVTQALHTYRVPVDAIHWDLTHVTFAGAHDGSELIGPGYGGGRLHERQLKVSLHASSEGGIPLRHQILPGPNHQAPYASAMLDDLKRRLQRTNLIVVSDRAGITDDNIVAYRRAHGHLIGPLQTTAVEEEQLNAVPLEQFQPLEYRSQHAPQHAYSYYATTLTLHRQKRAEPLDVPVLFIHSTAKQQRDAEDRDKRLTQALDRLETIERQLNWARFAKADYVQGQIDKAIPDALSDIIGHELSGEDRDLSLAFGVHEQALAAAARSDGRYVLVADVPAADPDEIFERFQRQHVIERRFRNLKSDLSVHPVFLHDERRIHALLLLFVLALIVYTLLELCSERAGLETERYHKMTARELIWRFAYVSLLDVRIRGRPPRYQLTLSTQQQYLLGELGFPDLTAYLRLN